MATINKEAALNYHSEGQPGKISITPTKPMETQYELGLAYTPGVAYPVLEIAEKPELAYEYTSKGNLVAVISNGTAILGLGDRGSLAAKPVMEGKSVLFKKFADVDAIDIEIDSHDPDTIINVSAAIAGTFGGINLEDIKSPECFYIEPKLQELVDIPVFHDDQHGTAIILGAAMINAFEITSRKFDEVKVVFSGAGAASISCARHLVKLGIPKENIWLCDSKGLVFKGRDTKLSAEKAEFAQETGPHTLTEVMEGADAFIGLSIANCVSPEMIKRMSHSPIIFPMSNPDPEIPYELILEHRPDALAGTGRSDFPNQINNVLGFPYIFRGALDVRASKINDEMKLAASFALADLAHEPVPADVLKAYNLDHLEFCKDYLIPKPFDKRISLWESAAVAKAAMETGVARLTVDIDEYRKSLRKRFLLVD